MYIRTHEQAIEALAGLLDLPDRRTQIVQSTVQVMLCLHEEPRGFLADAQALLIQGGLETLRQKRRDLMESQDHVPLIVLDPEGDLFFEAAAAALDALRLAEAVRQVFPEILHARWVVARALLAREADVRSLLAAGVRARGEGAAHRQARADLEAVLAWAHPSWAAQEERVRAACAEILAGSGLVEAARVPEEAAALFEVLASGEERALAFLESLRSDPPEAVHVALRLYEAMDAVRHLPQGEAARAAREAA